MPTNQVSPLFKSCLTLLTFASFALISASAHAGGWTQASGAGQFINQFTYFESSQYYDRSGDSHSEPTFSKLEYQPYAEYGLTDAYTIGADAFIQRDWQSDAHNDGIADPEIFLRARVYKDDKQVVSLQPLIKFASIFAHDDSTPRGGSKSTDAELSLLYGRSLNILSPADYLDTRLGYRARSGELHNQTKADIALGLSPATNWQIIPAIRYVRADALGSTVAFSENGDIDYDLLKAELGLAYHLNPKSWVQLSGFDHIAGKQTGSGEGVTIAYGMNF